MVPSEVDNKTVVRLVHPLNVLLPIAVTFGEVLTDTR
jgi:hypothetical protein